MRDLSIEALAGGVASMLGVLADTGQIPRWASVALSGGGGTGIAGALGEASDRGALRALAASAAQVLGGCENTRHVMDCRLAVVHLARYANPNTMARANYDELLRLFTRYGKPLKTATAVDAAD